MRAAWRSGRGTMLLVFAGLEALAVASSYANSARIHAIFNPKWTLVVQVPQLAVYAFLVWRAWHGGRIAWGLLALLTAGTLIESLAILVSSPRSLYSMWLAAVLVAQFIVLMSPVVRRGPGFRNQRVPRELYRP
jgi:hypothetical protein